MAQQYRINDPRVAHETIDGETIIIDFDSGSYYGINGVGVVVWELIARGVPLRDILDAASHRYGAGTVNDALERFIAELSHEGLIVPVDHVPGPASVDTSVFPKLFEAPLLQKYTDMQDLLLLDPIHDVGDRGWPDRTEP